MEFFFSAVFTLFLVMDPFGNIPIFISVLRRVPAERRKTVLIRELCIAMFLMVAFMFLGKQFLSILGIKEYSLSIAGGLMLIMIAFKLVFGGNEEEPKSNPKDDEPFIVPLAIPMVAGPAALSVTLILAAQSPSKMLILAAVLTASAINFIILLLSFPISDFLGKRGIVAVERLTGMILVLMSVNMIMGGVATFLGK
ncbi:multiple antibiotic resistance protein [Elusimicrobium simillimum]|uniref:MarC family protein n=1 Tax=Elusimicrobium simillimum TaxID=3143438 RepID=UPI003C6ED814